jgi:purine nucleoside permease
MRALTSAVFGLALFFGLTFQQLNHMEDKRPMNVKKITPVLLVNEIEPILPFWIDRLGFTKTIEVPDGNKLGFAAFQKAPSK